MSILPRCPNPIADLEPGFTPICRLVTIEATNDYVVIVGGIYGCGQIVPSLICLESRCGRRRGPVGTSIRGFVNGRHGIC